MVEYWNHNPRVRGSTPFSVKFKKGDYSSVVECLIVDQKIMGSIPINYPFLFFSLNSSVVEHWTENPRVAGSIPALSNFLKLL